MLSKLEAWDYISLFLICVGLWLVLGGAKKLAAASPDRVEAKPLIIRGIGAIAIGVAYLLCHYHVLKG